MEKLMEKQVKWQKITAMLLMILLATLVFAGIYISKAVNEMTAAMERAEVFLEETTEKLGTFDLEGGNQAFTEIDELVNSMDGFAVKANGMAETINDVVKKLEEAFKTFGPIIETLDSLQKKLSFF